MTAYLEWERQDFEEAVEGIRRGYEDVRAGRTRTAAEFLGETVYVLHIRHGRRKPLSIS